MKATYTLFLRGAVFYIQDSATRKQTSLRTKDEIEARSLLNAHNEATRQVFCRSNFTMALLPVVFSVATWMDSAA